MPCPYCPHCKDLINPAALTLSLRPSTSTVAGVNDALYREFGLAYDRARQLKVRPRTAILAANPWMSASQANTYLKRARALGFVQAPARRGITAPVPAPVTDPAPVREKAPAASARRGGRLRGRPAMNWTPEQSADVFFHDSIQAGLASAKQLGRPMTADRLCFYYSEKLSERQAQATLDWAAVEGYAERCPGGGILPV